MPTQSPMPMRGRIPLYERIATDLIERIASGTLSPGARLPSEAELQEEFGVSRVTIRQALEILGENGLIERYRRRGSYVVEDLPHKQLQGFNDGGGVIQFLHLGFQREEALIFSRTEVEIAERFFASRGRVLAWSALRSHELMAGAPPPSISQGSCVGLLVDGILTQPHLEYIASWNVPFVVMGNHDIEEGWHQVCFDPRVAAERLCAMMIDNQLRDLVVIEHPETNTFHHQICSCFPQALLDAGLPPMRVIAASQAAQADFWEQLGELSEAAAVYTVSGAARLLAPGWRIPTRNLPPHRLMLLTVAQDPVPDVVLPLTLCLMISAETMVAKAGELLEALIQEKNVPESPVYVDYRSSPAPLAAGVPAVQRA